MVSIPAPFSMSNMPMELTVRGLVPSMNVGPSLRRGCPLKPIAAQCVRIDQKPVAFKASIMLFVQAVNFELHCTGGGLLSFPIKRIPHGRIYRNERENL